MYFSIYNKFGIFTRAVPSITFLFVYTNDLVIIACIQSYLCTLLLTALFSLVEIISLLEYELSQAHLYEEEKRIWDLVSNICNPESTDYADAIEYTWHPNNVLNIDDVNIPCTMHGWSLFCLLLDRWMGLISPVKEANSINYTICNKS